MKKVIVKGNNVQLMQPGMEPQTLRVKKSRRKVNQVAPVVSVVPVAPLPAGIAKPQGKALRLRAAKGMKGMRVRTKR